MENENKAPALVVGIFVVIFILLIIVGGYMLFIRNRSKNNKIAGATTSITPTPSNNTTSDGSIIIKKTSDNTYLADVSDSTSQTKLDIQIQDKGGTITKTSKIPKTGVEIIFYPLITSGLTLGIYLKKRV
jgi:hypothetical protein